MCIAIAVRPGVKCPTLETLRNCWDSNPDGAGFAFNDRGSVIIKKGFMTWDSFKNAWERYSKEFNFTERGVLIHFRITTHGGTNPQNTHPFPVVADTGMMQKPESVCEYAAIHNGIISLTSAKATSEHTTSDTLVFIRDYLSLIAQNKAWFKRRANLELISELIDAPHSKMAILNGRGEIICTDGFIADNGVLYSNTSYKVARIRSSRNYNYNYGYNYNDFDDELDDYYGRGYGYGYDSPRYDSYYQNGQKKRFDPKPANTSDSDGDKVALMRCDAHDTVRSDCYPDQYIDNDNERLFAVSREGFLYEFIKNPNSHGGDDEDDWSFSFIGSGCFIDEMNRVKEFVPNFFAREGQFLADSYPAEISSWGEFVKDDEDDIIDLDDDIGKNDKKKDGAESVGTKDTSADTSENNTDNDSANDGEPF